MHDQEILIHLTSLEFLTLLVIIFIVKLAIVLFMKTGLLGRTLCGMDRGVSQVLHSPVQDIWLVSS